MPKKVGAAVLVLFVTSSWAFAQATSTINGRITDQAGAVLPGATVTVTNVATGATRETISNAEGLYTVPALTAGTYAVKADITGFTAYVRDGIELLTGSNLTVDAQLGLASLQENVTVTAQSPLVEATQATLSASIRQS